MTTFYKKKDEVKLEPGQTLGFTAGKGYYAAGKPAAPKPSSAPAKPSSKAKPTATRPVAAKTPTAPPSHANTPPATPGVGAPDRETSSRSDALAGRSQASTTPKLSESTAFYTRAGDVPLGPGQTLGYEAGKGYYAAGRPQPTKASTTPGPSTVKVMAMSSRASTESPLVERVETRDGRTTITLSHATKPAGDKASQERKVAAHATERSAKPSKDATHRTAVETKKASSRVHEQLAKTRDRSGPAKSGIGHHPGRAEQVAHAARAKDHSPSGFGNVSASLAAAIVRLKTGKTFRSPPRYFDLGVAVVKTELDATVHGVQIKQQNGNLIFSVGKDQLYSLPLTHFEQVVGRAGGHVVAIVNELRSLSTPERKIDGTTYRVTPHGNGVSLSATRGDVENEVTLTRSGEIEISTTVTEHAPGSREPVDLGITTTIQPGLRASPQRPTTRAPSPDEVRDLAEALLAALLATLAKKTSGGTGAPGPRPGPVKPPIPGPVTPPVVNPSTWTPPIATPGLGLVATEADQEPREGSHTDG